MNAARVVDATAERWDDVVAVMGTRGDAAACWCQFFRLKNADYRTSTVDSRRTDLHDLVRRSPPPGVIGYAADGAPAAWCGIAPRSGYPRLATSVISKATSDEDGLWSVVCFVVRVGVRRQGLSAVVLDGAIDLARRHGARAIEAYPIDVGVRTPSSSALYHGALHVFEHAGFTEVARPKPDRPVVRQWSQSWQIPFGYTEEDPVVLSQRSSPAPANPSGPYKWQAQVATGST